MLVGQSATQRLLAANRRTYTFNYPSSVRTHRPDPAYTRPVGRGEQYGGSSKSARSYSRRLLFPRRHQRQPSGFPSDPFRDKLSPKELTAAIIEELGKVQKQTEHPGFGAFRQSVASALNRSEKPSRETAQLLSSLRQSFNKQGRSGLRTEIKYAYHGYLASQRFSISNLQDQAKITDIRYPVEWYPATRQMQRTIHLHVGPTNSGKTYRALKKLEQAQSGLYAGPLRLLAHEVYTRLNARGIACNLITGDERQFAEAKDVNMSSCTVEMVPVNHAVDVAVIDEIQMIGHEQRGWAWTQAIMGLKAKELHLCGEERTVPLIRELVAAMGDSLQIHHYQRLSPLKTMSASLRGNLSNLRKGDCVVAFSKLQIHRLKKQIEFKTRKPVAVVYGSLPPEVRAQQAGLFNDPNNDYDILVASDAIGMGLNLSVKRIIFHSAYKFNGRTTVPMEISQIKQIAGRAGRYRTASQATDQETSMDESSGAEAQGAKVSLAVSPPNLGLVTTLERGDLSSIQSAMESQADPIMSAGLFPPVDVLVRFAAYFPPSTPFSYILQRLHSTSILHPRFHLCSLKDHLEIADTIEPVRNLTISDRIIFCASPASVRDETLRPVLHAFAKCVGDNTGGGILDIKALDLELLNVRFKVGSRDHLQRLESLHKALILYLWLSYRFAGVFNTQAMAFYVKKLVEDRIQQALSKVVNEKNNDTCETKRILQRHDEPKNLAPDTTDDGLSDDEQPLTPGHKPLPFSKNLGARVVTRETAKKPEVGLDVTILGPTTNQGSLSKAGAP
ncbi:MAG: hypothetical protein Q9216_001746 [Gyalolechia sp. 2 TL-2023]